MKAKRVFGLLMLVCFLCLSVQAKQRQMEYLDRGLVAVKVSQGVFLSWRLLGNEQNAQFNIYKNEVQLLNNSPITGATNYTDMEGKENDLYQIKKVVNGLEIDSSKKIAPWSKQFLTIQLNRPSGGTTPDGVEYTYTPNDCSVGDLDGDGVYELIVKWDPSNSKDNSLSGYTGNVFIDAYKLDGSQLWRVDLGINIRAGAHYTQFLVYDFDGDGMAELVCKTAPGTVDGLGKNVLMNSDDPKADYRNRTTNTTGTNRMGYILKGPEYLTLFKGDTGQEMHTIAYIPPRHPSIENPTPSQQKTIWGDDYGNRIDRFLACVAYLDGVHPSIVMCRGYYSRAVLAAFDVVDKKMVNRWIYDSGSSTNTKTSAYKQGNHGLAVGDLDSDGFDEIVYGSAAIDHDGKLLYSTAKNHGDAGHLSDLDPDNPGLEWFQPHEEIYGIELREAGTGKILFWEDGRKDVGRGIAADIDVTHRGFEFWSTDSSNVYNIKGVPISTKRPSVNFRIYWDGDLQDELLDGTKLDKWNGNGTTRLFTFYNYGSSKEINSTKANPCLSADLFGDWREEVIYYDSSDPSKLNLFTTIIPTDNRLYTLMHDPVYRLSIAWQNTAYNQPPHLGFYIGDGLQSIPWPDMYTIKSEVNTGLKKRIETTDRAFIDQQGVLHVNSNEQIKSIQVVDFSGIVFKTLDEINQREIKLSLGPDKSKSYIVRIVTTQGVSLLKIGN